MQTVVFTPVAAHSNFGHFDAQERLLATIRKEKARHRHHRRCERARRKQKQQEKRDKS